MADEDERVTGRPYGHRPSPGRLTRLDRLVLDRPAYFSFARAERLAAAGSRLASIAVASGVRLTIRSKGADPRSAGLVADAHALGLTAVTAIDVADVVFFADDLPHDHLAELEAVLVDPLLQTGTWDVPADGIETAAAARCHRPGRHRHPAGDADRRSARRARRHRQALRHPWAI